MNKLESKSNWKPHRRNVIAVLAAVFRFLCVLVLAGLIAGVAPGAELQRPPLIAAAPGLPFAIADFDGDLHPDLASVQVGSSDSSQSVYWIQLQLTAAGRQSIRLVAPVGGLQLLARDVNGDHAIDLVVMTAGLGQPVAVFLNDGRGGFSQADKNVFPDAFGNSSQNFTSPANSLSGSAGIPPQTRPAFSSRDNVLFHFQRYAGLLALSSSCPPLDLFLTCHSGRAPPSDIAHS